MTIVAVALAAVLVVAIGSFGQLLRWQQRAHARREDLLLNQLLNLAGKPWLPAPADEPKPPVPVREPEAPRYTATPEAFAPGWGLADLVPAEPGLSIVPPDWREAS